ncbi:hypothetical protein EH165_01050 [Nakamurella antarctica]|uniref:Uncharacterized protein n=1 Tax=Nakamurella antarctica TaxID=1902245 RepID=A0A3G8ZSB9_9ACTN|nr:hypothetical protein [Nakamurella antarctica]AZI56966.1 hypothetical protein EH165_01050 [Nakamurella antarctica]
MELTEMYDYIENLIDKAATQANGDTDDSTEFALDLTKIELISKARVALDIIEALAVHRLRTSLPQASYGDIGESQGISKQASRIRHTKLEQVLKVHQIDGKRHAMAKVVAPTKHRRAAKPTRVTRKELQS